jgi:hypothetical protein
MKPIAKWMTAGLLLLAMGAAQAGNDHHDRYPVKLKVFAPAEDDVAGVQSRGFLVDFAAEFPGDLAATGASLELTGPGPLANAGPFPGTFSLGADADHFPGLVVLLSSTRLGAGAGQNVANLFNILAVTNRTPTSTEIWGTWIIGAKNAFGVEGQMTPSRLFVTVVEGTAPDVVSDMNNDGMLDNKDLVLMGHRPLTKGKKVDFVVNGL